jgi:molybdenum cofactor synthesis domain-containing protein
MTPAAVITVSDSCFRHEREDLSGPAVTAELISNGFDVILHLTVPDERPAIEDALRKASKQARFVVTTGGTGIAPRDVTPEATMAVCNRLIDGIAELMRSEGRHQTILASLSRAVCGCHGTTLILNLPGSPRGAVASLSSALPVVPHALALLKGEVRHDDESSGSVADHPATHSARGPA